MIKIQEKKLTEELMRKLIRLSEIWEAEESCYGYRKNTRTDLEGRRVWTAEKDGVVIGYLFGCLFVSEKDTSILPAGTKYFEVEELFVIKEERSKGIGRQLYTTMETDVQETEWFFLATAAKNWRSILHFYIDELGMSFWSARLFKKKS